MFISPITPQINYSFNKNVSHNNCTSPSFCGWSPESENNAKKIYRMANIIKSPKTKSIAVSGHKNPDGDSISSCIACAELLHQATGRTVDVYISGQVQPNFKFLTENTKGINIIEMDSNTKLDKKYDLCVSVDTPTSKLMNGDYYNKIFKRAFHTFKIDHHPNPNTGKGNNSSGYDFAEVNLTDTNCGSASEVLMQFVQPLGISPRQTSKRFTDAVYSGMISDTNGFRYVHTPLIFNDAALLLTKGTDHSEITGNIYTQRELPQSITDLDNALKAKTQFNKSGKIAYIAIDDELEELLRKAEKDTDQVTANNRIKRAIGLLVETNKAQIAFNTRIIKNSEGYEEVVCSMRSNKIKINSVASQYGGGGHDTAAGLRIPSKNRTSQDWANTLVKDFEKLVK